MTKVTTLSLTLCALALGTTSCETTKREHRYHEYVIVEKDRKVRHHHHHIEGEGGRKTYHVYEVKGSDGDHVHHHYVELTPKQERDLRALHDQKHADHHGRAVKANKTHEHTHKHSR